LAVIGDRGPRLEDCTLRRNEATLHGGGVWWDGPATGRIVRTVLVSNRALAGGGLAAAGASGLQLISVTVTDNLAGGTGGGLWVDGGAPAVRRSLLVRNHGSLGGGGLHARGARVDLDGCTVADNGSEGSGGLLLEGGQPRITRSIVAFNDGAAIQLISATPAIDGTNIYGHPGGDWTGPLADLAGRGGNFSLDPLFCSLESGRFDLSARSPCLPDNRPGGQRVGASGRGCP
jgi:hypothetical protein